MKNASMKNASMVLFIVGLLGLALIPTPASACSCVLSSLEAAREEATAVFEGTLDRFEDVGDVTYAVFRVRRVWKGQMTRNVRVRAARLTMCPPHLEVGATRIVYAMGPARDLRIEPCSRTAFSHNDAAELGASRPPRSSSR